jgi:hypothetical protein
MRVVSFTVIVATTPASDFSVIVSLLMAVTVPSSRAVDAVAVWLASARAEAGQTASEAEADKRSANDVFSNGIRFEISAVFSKVLPLSSVEKTACQPKKFHPKAMKQPFTVAESYLR